MRCLRVEHVIVMGHTRCGGIRALLGDIRCSETATQFISPWMSIADDARREALAASSGATLDELASACERAAVRASLRNLMTFPFVREAVGEGSLELHGWYFDLDRGELLVCSPASAGFEVAVAGS